jgi:hypothetical protein
MSDKCFMAAHVKLVAARSYTALWIDEGGIGSGSPFCGTAAPFFRLLTA